MQSKVLIFFLFLSALWLLSTMDSAAETVAAATTAQGGAPPWSEARLVQSGPSLAIPTEMTVKAGQSLSVPIAFQPNGHAIAAVVFSIDFDERCLLLDPRDDNGDGRPDAITWVLPAGMNATVAVDLSDTDGELDFIIADYFPPFLILPAQNDLITLTFSTTCQPTDGETVTATVAFATSPAPSFGDTGGGSIAGETISGVVRIVSAATAATATPTATPTPTLIATTPGETLTPTATSTATPTPTLIPTKPPIGGGTGSNYLWLPLILTDQ